MSAVRETVVILVTALVLSFLIKTFLVQPFYIPSDSMNDTLLKNDKILVTKFAPGPLDVHRGDIVVFKDPGGWLRDVEAPHRAPLAAALNSVATFVGLLPTDAGQHLIKRTIGTPGDTVACCDTSGRLTVNGTAVDEPYLKPGSVPSEMSFSITVPPASLWVMGDNRQDSEDSRFHQGNPGGGSVPMANVVGVAFVKIWPGDRAGWLRNPGSVFAHVPGPVAPAK